NSCIFPGVIWPLLVLNQELQAATTSFFLFLIGFIHFVQIKQKCGGEGHISKDCANPTTPKSCYNCGDSGHIYSLGDQKCFHCGEVGHISRDCCVLKLRIVTPAVNQDTSFLIMVGQMKKSDQAALIAAKESNIVSDSPEESK
ncbi:hypothetical protein PSHT_01148, partial [Puccinia striiformis]